MTFRDGWPAASRKRASTVVLFMVLATVMPAPSFGSDSAPTIVVFTPTSEGNTYWPQVYEIMHAAAADLGIDLRTYEFDVSDRFAKVAEGTQILRSLPVIDGAVFSVSFGQTAPLLDIAEELGFPVMIQGPLFEDEREIVGPSPRIRYPQWIATFREDESGKGYQLGRLLIDRARELGLAGPEGRLTIAGIGGDPSWFGSHERAAGLERAAMEDPAVRLTQVVSTEWTQRDGEVMAIRLLRRYPDLSVLWAASDQLAIGAVRGAQQQGYILGEDIVVGGLDLSRRGLDEVVAGRLSATVASPLFSWAEVLIYLYDYIQGFDFAELTGTELVFSPRSGVGATAQEIRTLYQDVSAIDYAELSRGHPNSGVPAGGDYRFPWSPGHGEFR